MLTIDDVTIVVRTRAFGRVGAIDLGQASDTQLIKRYNQVGAWKMTLPNGYYMAANLKNPGAEIVAYVYDKPFLSGPMVSWTVSEDQDDPLGTTTFVGADDMIHLSDRIVYPTPTTPSITDQGDYDYRQGVGETVMKGYVSSNLGPLAPAVRRHSAVTMAPDLSRGGQVTFSARYQVLGELMATLGTAAGLGFDMVRQGEQIVFDVYVPRDLSRLVLMDIDNGLLDKNESSLSAPDLTVALVAGQGDLEDRSMLEVVDALSLQAQSDWGRRIEQFVDYSSAGAGGVGGDGDPDDEMQQSGQNRLEDGGRTILSLKVTPTNLETMAFAKDWFVGDIIGVVVDQQALSATVSEAIIAIDDDVHVGATVGDPSNYDWESQVTSQIQDHERRISRIEKG